MHEIETRVRYSETDQMGVVYHANYLTYFEIGRTELIRDQGIPYAEVEGRGLRLAVVEANVRYRAPAHYDEVLRITTRVVEATPVRVRFEYTVRRRPEGKLLVEGQTVLACIDKNGRPRRMPAELREALVRIATSEGSEAR